MMKENSSSIPIEVKKCIEEGNSYGIIYKIENIINKKIYIGKTIKPVKNRIKQHINSKGMSYIGVAIENEGIESFEYSIIDVALNKDELKDKENYWINFYHSFELDKGYNIMVLGIPIEKRIKFIPKYNCIAKLVNNFDSYSYCIDDNQGYTYAFSDYLRFNYDLTKEHKAILVEILKIFINNPIHFILDRCKKFYSYNSTLEYLINSIDFLDKNKIEETFDMLTEMQSYDYYEYPLFLIEPDPRDPFGSEDCYFNFNFDLINKYKYVSNDEKRIAIGWEKYSIYSDRHDFIYCDYVVGCDNNVD